MADANVIEDIFNKLEQIAFRLDMVERAAGGNLSDRVQALENVLHVTPTQPGISAPPPVADPGVGPSPSPLPPGPAADGVVGA